MKIKVKLQLWLARLCMPSNNYVSYSIIQPKGKSYYRVEFKLGNEGFHKLPQSFHRLDIFEMLARIHHFMYTVYDMQSFYKVLAEEPTTTVCETKDIL